MIAKVLLPKNVCKSTCLCETVAKDEFRFLFWQKLKPVIYIFFQKVNHDSLEQVKWCHCRSSQDELASHFPSWLRRRQENTLSPSYAICLVGICRGSCPRLGPSYPSFLRDNWVQQVNGTWSLFREWIIVIVLMGCIEMILRSWNLQVLLTDFW